MAYILNKPVEISYSEGRPHSGFHSHPWFELYYFHGGKGNYLIGDKIWVLAPGDLILMNGMTLHCPNVDPTVPYRRTIVHFDPAFVKAFADLPLSVNLLQPFYELRNYRIRLTGEIRAEVEEHLVRLIKLDRFGGKAAGDRFLLQFLDFLLLVSDLCQRDSDMQPCVFPSEKERHVQNMIDLLERHYHEDLHLEQLEERLHLNKYYLSKLFKEVTGFTIFDYLYHRRINQAKIHFMLDRHCTVTDVCYKVGFKHPSHFTRLFKSRVGCTPEQFRKQHAATYANDSQYDSAIRQLE